MDISENISEAEYEARRVSLRRATHELNDSLWDLRASVLDINPDAASALRRAHLAIFEAWTHLCTPPDDHDDDDPSH